MLLIVFQLLLVMKYISESYCKVMTLCMINNNFARPNNPTCVIFYHAYLLFQISHIVSCEYICTLPLRVSPYFFVSTSPLYNYFTWDCTYTTTTAIFHKILFHWIFPAIVLGPHRSENCTFWRSRPISNILPTASLTVSSAHLKK